MAVQLVDDLTFLKLIESRSFILHCVLHQIVEDKQLEVEKVSPLFGCESLFNFLPTGSSADHPYRLFKEYMRRCRWILYMSCMNS